MIMTQPRSALATPNSQTALPILCLSSMEVLLQVSNHLIARIPIRPQESMVVTNTVKALADLLLAEILALVLRSKRLYRTLLRFDLLLDVASRAAFGVDLLGRDRDEVVPEEVDGVVRLEDAVDALDGLDAGEAQQILDLRALTVLYMDVQLRSVMWLPAGHSLEGYRSISRTSNASCQSS